MKQKSKNDPLVSIVMPVYNSDQYLSESIYSILNQTYKNFELIIIDDRSTDKSPSIIKTFKKRFPKQIKILRTPHNLNHGGDKCANIGISIARGKYIARMDADDISLSTRQEKQVLFLENNPEVFIVGSNANIIDKKGNIIGEKLEPVNHSEIYKSYPKFHPLIHSSCIMRRMVKNKPFMYKIAYSANNDYHTFFKLICKGFKFANLPEKLIYLRIHDKNDTYTNVRKKFLNIIRIRALMWYKYNYKLSFKDLAISVLQTIVVFLLPQTITLNIYFFLKGIKKPKNIIFESLPKFQERTA